jgi:peptidoglycan/xylan/chitin deacetylase (PgdA/CDA1 family)
MISTPPTCVLMYHATPAPGVVATGHDPHYAVDLEALARHLDLARACGLGILHVRAAATDPRPVCAITFDDGHATNAEAAALLVARGASADFFVNTSDVGGRDRLDWSALRQMASAGMSIQSHGHTHRHFDSLEPAEIRDELHRSKHDIEQAIGQPVLLFAPPGGRLRPEVATIARELGYEGICSSRPGAWQRGTGVADVPRFAVLAGTADTQLERWLRADAAELRRARLRKGALDLGKRVLGPGLYERLRAAAVAAGGR